MDAVTRDLNRYLKEQDALSEYEDAFEAKQEELYDLTVWQLMKLLDKMSDREMLALLVREEAHRQVRAMSEEFNEPDEDEFEDWPPPGFGED